MKKLDVLFRPVDNSPLILFRIVFGLLLFFEAWGAILTGWVRRAFIEPAHTFHFIDFSWLQPLPGDGMYYYYIVMGIAGLMIMFGFYYRVGMTIYAFMWAGVYLMQKTNYNNHYYLAMLLCFVMILLPANTYASWDARKNPKIKRLTCPQWCLWFFMLQIGIVYFYASVAKMYPDWLQAKPIEIWFNAKRDYPIIGEFLQYSWLHYIVAYGGIFFDLLVVPAMLWKKTRKFAFAISIFFHLFNSAVFQIGIFPYLGIAFAAFFFPPETIHKIFFKRKPTPEEERPSDSVQTRPWIAAALAIWFVIQVLLPVRHWFYPSNVYWTEEGHRLSWRMMLRAKGGYVNFKVVDHDTGEEWTERPRDYITRKQSNAIAGQPDMCWQFVQILKKGLAARGKTNISIYARGKLSLNGSKFQPLYDPEYDLAKVKWEKFRHSPWLLPQEESN